MILRSLICHVYKGLRLNNIRYQSNKNLSSMQTISESNIVWIDLEMTGLDVQRDFILEIACLVTDSELNIIAEHPSIIINQPIDVLESMNDWCKEHHAKTNLTELSLNSKINVKSAESTVLKFLENYTVPGKNVLAGNSIYVDRMFLTKYMPILNQYLHYRIIDVSSVKELTRRWNINVYKSAPKKQLVHRALDDIKESITELLHYKSFMFK